MSTTAHDPQASGEQDKEQGLQIPCEVYSRIVGYLRPVQNWHQGKQQEFRERTAFRVPESIPDDNVA